MPYSCLVVGITFIKCAVVCPHLELHFCFELVKDVCISSNILCIFQYLHILIADFLLSCTHLSLKHISWVNVTHPEGTHCQTLLKMLQLCLILFNPAYIDTYYSVFQVSDSYKQTKWEHNFVKYSVHWILNFSFFQSFSPMIYII